jgi:hypothetical protein
LEEVSVLLEFNKNIIEKNSSICSLGNISRASDFGAGILMYTGHRPMMQKLSNSEYE